MDNCDICKTELSPYDCDERGCCVLHLKCPKCNGCSNKKYNFNLDELIKEISWLPAWGGTGIYISKETLDKLSNGEISVEAGNGSSEAKSIAPQTITFKSLPHFYYKELDGTKPNTIRSVEEKDERYDRLNLPDRFPKYIKIVNAGNPSLSFTREITDISAWGGSFIISWKHPVGESSAIEANKHLSKRFCDCLDMLEKYNDGNDDLEDCVRKALYYIGKLERTTIPKSTLLEFLAEDVRFTIGKHLQITDTTALRAMEDLHVQLKKFIEKYRVKQ